MRYAKIIKYDTGNWEGINTTIFFSGCNFKCEGCFNSVAQDFDYGTLITDEIVDKFIYDAQDSHVSGICILGGEPFHQNLDELYDFVKKVKEKVQKPIHLWSGFSYEDLIADKKKVCILELVDTLVDGQFVISKKDLSLRFRGSSNQRVIDVQKSLSSNNIVLIDS